MLQNYFKLALRNIIRNKMVSFINILGLSTAIGVAIFVFTFVDFEFSIDQQHDHRQEIFLITNQPHNGHERKLDGHAPVIMGPLLLQELPQVKAMTRVDDGNAVFRQGSNVFNETVRFVDPAFMEMFTFPIKQGDKHALSDKSQIIISTDIAHKYFGDRDPVGQPVTLTFAGTAPGSFLIGAVAEEFPANAGLTFSVLINWENRKDVKLADDPSGWNDVAATFILLYHKEDRPAMERGMGNYIQIQNQADPGDPTEAFFLEPFDGLSLRAYKIEGDIVRESRPTGRIILSVMAAILLLITCFNYIHTALASATKRVKEIGVRKSVGGARRQLIGQFLLENMVLCVFAMIFGAILSKTLFEPLFNNLFGLAIRFDILNNYHLWIFLTALLVFVGFASGIYPAFYISALKPVDILRGGVKLSGKNNLSRIFLTFQFTVCLLAIVCGIVFIQNVSYLRHQDWGYKADSLYVIGVPDGKTFEQLRNELARNKDVIYIAGSVTPVGYSSERIIVSQHGEDHDARNISVGTGYAEMLGLTLVDGHLWNKELKNGEQQVVVNEAFVREMNWATPLDQEFVCDSVKYAVVGVVRNFHYRNFARPIEPLMLRGVSADQFRWLTLKLKENKPAGISASFEKIWRTTRPDVPYEAFFQNTVFERYFSDLSKVSGLMVFSAALIVLLSTLGLFGLVSLNVASRMKEFTIKKVLGAGLSHAIKDISRQYVWILVSAAVIGLPMSYFVITSFLNAVYANHISVNALSLTAGALLILAIVLTTTSSMVVKVLGADPAKQLRND